jgi:hypothetical protein
VIVDGIECENVLHRDRAADIVLVLEETFGRSLLIRITLTAAMM